jgi:BirA family biotin operon repressor/biotin-[acetyl-CoA-carboxylase] ligase
MDQLSIEACLRDLQLAGIRYFPTIDSTNDEAWRWVKASAPHAALVIADEQSAGRGRFQRRWVTAAGSGLAFSLVLSLALFPNSLVSRLAGLAAIAVCRALQVDLKLQAQVKWPNDILLDQRKTGGILVESRWEGEKPSAAVIGIGINIAPGSISPVNLPPSDLNFPATCIEDVAGHPVDRLELLHAVLQEFFHWLNLLPSPTFISEWNQWLAFRGRWVELARSNPEQKSPQAPTPAPLYTGRLIGLDMDGSLRLITTSGEQIIAQVGELQLRLTDPPYLMENDRHV